MSPREALPPVPVESPEPHPALTTLRLLVRVTVGAAALAGRLVHNDGNAVLAWAQSVTDQERRNQLLESTAQSGIHQDRHAAAEWIAQSALPEETRLRLLDQIESMQR